MALEAVRRHLYPRDKAALLKICGALRPNTEGKTSMVEREVRSVVLVVRGMDGVAYTTGSRHDDAHKQIHLSADYVESLMHRWADEDEGGEERPARSAEVPKQQQDRQQQRSRMRHEQKVVAKTTVAPATRSALLSPSSRDDAPRIVTAGDHRPDKDRTGGRDRRRRRTGGLRNVEFEVRGVLVHELVHTVQFDGDGTAPGGLIEGIADWIRLKAGFAPSHWKRGVIGDSWDAGYERTAFFLDFASSFVGMRFLVPHLNQALAWHRWIVDDDDVKTALKHRRLRRCGNGEEDGRDGDDEEEPFTLFECLTGYSIAEVWRAYENSVER
ncbi:uncharacterized protein PSFLO_05923 [Pseudozyma flocculosa]|nr:uncharacterized protein PSFLO_05923 [Pseudozyma flocculosa]